MSHTRIVPIILTSILGVGCSQPTSPVSPSSIALTVDAGAALGAGSAPAHVRTFEISGELEGTYAGSGEPPLITVHVEGGGTASHLGRFTFESTHVVNFIDFTGSGTASLVAANGDRLTGNEHGVATPLDGGVFHIVETLTITSGTGRFAGASGEIVIERLTFPNGPDNGMTTGSIQGHVVVGQ